MLTYKISPSQYVIRVYDGSHPNKYCAHALVKTFGDRGFVSSIIRKDFYKALADNVIDIMTTMNCRTLERYMSDKHVKLLTRVLRATCDVTITDRGVCEGMEMPWVVVTPR